MAIRTGVGGRPKLTVLVPTWRRNEDLSRCLDALAGQVRPADRVVVVWRRGDEGVHAVLERHAPRLPLVPVETTVPGVVEAMNRGLAAALDGILAITDDDSAPFPDWLSRMEEIYASDPRIVAVGGRDLVHVHGIVLPDRNCTVGRLSWFGRQVGSHHEGKGAMRDVDFLKGVNCSFRLEATDGRRFDRRLRGTGAQQHWEMGFFLPLRAKGRIVYDPSLLVDHYPAIRHDEDQRDAFNWTASSNGGFNESLVILENLGMARNLVFVPWSILIGNTAHPGIAQGLRQILRGTPPAIAAKRVAATVSGRLGALRTHCFGRKDGR